MRKEIRIIINDPLLLITLPIAFVILIFLKFIKNKINIRFGFLSSDRIGHFAANTEMYILQNQFPKSKVTFDILYLPTKPCNKQLAKMWKSKLRIWPRFLVRPFCLITRKLQIFNDFVTGRPISKDRDILNMRDNTDPIISFNDMELEYGSNLLKKFGLKKNDKFVCLIVRDSKYLNTFFSGGDWSYHNYRNSDIDTYIKACEYLTEQGYFVFRMGKIVEKKINSLNPKIIDYPYSPYKSDFMDIFLTANCSFVISTSTGLDAVPLIFRKPILYVNIAPLIDIISSSKKNLILFKKYQYLKNNNKLNMKEIFSSSAGFSYDLNDYKKNNIKLIDNSEDEILDTTREMLELIESNFQKNSELLKLESIFWNNFHALGVKKCNENLHGKLKANISSKILINDENFYNFQ